MIVGKNMLKYWSLKCFYELGQSPSFSMEYSAVLQLDRYEACSKN